MIKSMFLDSLAFTFITNSSWCSSGSKQREGLKNLEPHVSHIYIDDKKMHNAAFRKYLAVRNKTLLFRLKLGSKIESSVFTEKRMTNEPQMLVYKITRYSRIPETPSNIAPWHIAYTYNSTVCHHIRTEPQWSWN